MQGLDPSVNRDGFDDEILQWLVTLSERWTTVDTADLPPTKLTALHCCIQTGLVELKFPCTAWAEDRHARIRGTFFVSGPWQPPDLTRVLRTHFVDWSKQRVSIQQDACQQARLTFDGVQAQQDAANESMILRLTAISAAKAMSAPSQVRFRVDQFDNPPAAAAVATAAIGDVVIHNHIDVHQPLQATGTTRRTNDPAGTSSSRPKAPTKKERIEVWLEQYVSRHQEEYNALLPLVGFDRNAHSRFRTVFKPAELAKQFTREDGADGDGRQESSNKTIIQRSVFYRTRIKPVLQGSQPIDERELRRASCNDTLDQLGL